MKIKGFGIVRVLVFPVYCLIKSFSSLPKARFKRRILHVPHLMQMRKIYCFRSFALDSAHVKCDV